MNNAKIRKLVGFFFNEILPESEIATMVYIDIGFSFLWKTLVNRTQHLEKYSDMPDVILNIQGLSRRDKIHRLRNGRHTDTRRSWCIGVTYAIAVMTCRGSCVKLNADYTLARVPATHCSLPLAFTPFSSFAPLHVSTSTTQSRGTPSTRGGYFTQSVAIIEYLPARLLCFSL